MNKGKKNELIQQAKSRMKEIREKMRDCMGHLATCDDNDPDLVHVAKAYHSAIGLVVWAESLRDMLKREQEMILNRIKGG
jgi:hypothetical protein